MLQEIMKGYYCYIVFIRQQGMKFNERRIGMLGNELSDFLFVGSQFEIDASLSFFGSNASGFTPLLEQVIQPRLAHGKVLDDIFDRIAFIVEFQNSFS